MSSSSATLEELERNPDSGIIHPAKMLAPIVHSGPVTGYPFHHHKVDLFGGSKPWDETEWAAQDDRLRGGISISHLTIHPISGSSSPSLGSPSAIATFHGNLDTKTLGGAGFASQRTLGDDRRWDLSDYDGIEVVVLIPPPDADLVNLGNGAAPAPTKGRVYTIVMKDCITRGEPGREISWEWNFKSKFRAEELEEEGHHKGPVKQYFRANWGEFKAFYRGRPVDEENLDVGKIKRFSIMIRSFFQEQQDGDFSVSLASISVVGVKKHDHRKNVLGEDIAENTCPLPATASQEKGGQRYFGAYDTVIDGEGVVDEKIVRRIHTRVNGSGWLEWLRGLWYN